MSDPMCALKSLKNYIVTILSEGWLCQHVPVTPNSAQCRVWTTLAPLTPELSMLPNGPQASLDLTHVVCAFLLFQMYSLLIQVTA